MLGDLDLKRLQNGLQGLPVPLELIVHRKADHPLDRSLAEAASEIAKASDGAVTAREAERDDLPAYPGMLLSYRGRDNLRYLALPHGPETRPFLDALLGLASGVVEPDAAWARPLAGLKGPAELLVFIGATCPHCPQAVSAALRIAVAHKMIRATIVDAEQFPELALRFNARSVPLTVLDEEWSHVGVLPVEDLVQRILSRGSAEYEQAVLRSMTEGGRTELAGLRLQRSGAVQAFAALWKGSATSDRMGLMLAVETGLEQDPRCLDAIVPKLIALLQSDDASLRGDTADLLGQIGHADAIAPLKDLIAREDNPDVKEIAEEALETIAGSDSS